MYLTEEIVSQDYLVSYKAQALYLEQNFNLTEEILLFL
jgi:hypothetical protein